MQTSVTFKNLDPSDTLKSYVTDKLNRFDRLLENPAEANVVLSVEKFRHIAEINIAGDRLTINGKEETIDMYSAIDNVLDKLEKQIEKIGTFLDESKLIKDLERYEEELFRLGAANAKIIKTEEIPVDGRVPLKCQIPSCFGYGTSAHCPPNTMKPNELRKYLENYQWAIFFTP